ncbi:MAG: hypothetical protein RLZZ232_3121 [Planctomycetota bacterium]|jgi:hypothetical protein
MSDYGSECIVLGVRSRLRQSPRQGTNLFAPAVTIRYFPHWWLAGLSDLIRQGESFGRTMSVYP